MTNLTCPKCSKSPVHRTHIKYCGRREELFWAKVQKAGPDECWFWTASVRRDGYGEFAAVPGKANVKAHRYAYALANGPIPTGKLVMHSCDQPLCVNPKHLGLGTDKSNSEDKFRKSRHQCGEDSCAAVLTEEQVREVRRDYRRFPSKKGGERVRSNLSELYERYKHTGITRGGLYQCARGDSWKHIK